MSLAWFTVPLMLAVIVGGFRIPPGIPEWPVDLLFHHEEYAEFAIRARRTELERLSEAEMVVLGTVQSAVGYWREGTIYTSATVLIDDCVSGGCPGDTLVLDFLGGTTPDGEGASYHPSGPPWAGPYNFTLPEAGKSYVLLVRRDDESDQLLGNLPRYGYEVLNGRVVRKGIPVGEFVDIIRRTLVCLRADTTSAEGDVGASAGQPAN